jgi:hypothetical protein
LLSRRSFASLVKAMTVQRRRVCNGFAGSSVLSVCATVALCSLKYRHLRLLNSGSYLSRSVTNFKLSRQIVRLRERGAMQCLRNLCTEFVSLNRLAAPAVFANAVDASFNVTTIIILGQLGKGHLAAGVIALAVYNICWYFVEGLLTAQDNLVARAFANKDKKLARYWSYIAAAVTVLVLVPTTALFVFGAVVVRYAFSIRPHTAAKAAWFLLLLLPGIWCHAFYRVAQKYFLCQKLMKMPIFCGLIGIAMNITCMLSISCSVSRGYLNLFLCCYASRRLCIFVSNGLEVHRLRSRRIRIKGGYAAGDERQRI